jgi:O-antigen ligase
MKLTTRMPDIQVEAPRADRIASASQSRSRNVLSVVFVVALGAALAYAVFFLNAPIAQTDRAGRAQRNVCLLALGIVALAQAILSDQWKTKKVDSRLLTWLALLLPAYAAFQLVPLPLSMLRMLSPSRAELLNALAPLSLRPDWASLSVAPALTLEHFLLFVAYAVMFLAVRDVSRSSRDMRWLPALPILAVAAWQAVWGVAQFFEGGEDAFAHGIYPNRNHFAGFLEMALPFAIGYGAVVFGRRKWHRGISTADAFRAGIGFTVAALIFTGIVCSLSRMGLASSGCSLVVMAALALTGRVRRGRVWAAVALLVLVLVIGLLVVAPTQLILRFSDVSSENRINVWHDTLRLIAAYPVFGCGLGGYISAFERFKTSGFDFAQDYAHNDYLHYLSELGAVGFLIGAIFLTLIGLRSLRAGVRHGDPDSRWLGLACAGSLAAILVHSLADFNLYVAANAMLLAWVCGLVGGIPEAGKTVEPRSVSNCRGGP